MNRPTSSHNHSAPQRLLAHCTSNREGGGSRLAGRLTVRHLQVFVRTSVQPRKVSHSQQSRKAEASSALPWNRA
jgi:hypothetical protein